MKVLLLVNPFSSSVTARTRVVIRKALAGDHDVELVETARRNHATRLAQGAAADGVEVVVVLGGDGTVNEAANGLAGSATALAVLPGGSTNVFARTIGLPNDLVEATAMTLEALEAGSIRRVGLGVANGRYFCFHVGLGFDAALVEQVEKRAGLKRWAGHALFMYPATTTASTPTSRFAIPTGTGWTTATSRTAATPTPTPSSATGPSTSLPMRRSTTGWPWSPFDPYAPTGP